MNWIKFYPTHHPAPGDYWCEVPALKLRSGGCLCRALYWTGERWEGPGGEYEVSRFMPEMLPQLHGRGDDASERTSSSAIDDTIEHLLGDISALSESIAEDEARAKARKLKLKTCLLRANALHHMSKDWRDVAQKMTDDGDDWKLASALARISDLEAEVSKSAKLFELVSVERNILVRRANELEGLICDMAGTEYDTGHSPADTIRSLRESLDAATARAEEADDRILELEYERDSMALRIERLSAELAKPENVRLREVTEAMAGRSVMFDDIAERVRQELHELGRWIERAGEAERKLAEANARIADLCCERHREDEEI